MECLSALSLYIFTFHRILHAIFLYSSISIGFPREPLHIESSNFSYISTFSSLSQFFLCYESF